MDNQLFLPIAAFAGLGVIVLGFWWISWQGKRRLDEQNARIARSQPAHAKVLQIGKSVVQENNGTVVVKLRVEVRPSGADPYPVTTVWEVQQVNLSQIQPERLVAVKIDADDAQKIYPNVGWAEFSTIYWQAWINEKRKMHT